jgi:hypothetical protein
MLSSLFVVNLQPTRRVVRQSTIINKIVDEKRKRTYSVDDATITEDNRVVRSADATDGTKTHGSQQLVVSTGGQDHGKGDTHNSNTSLGSRKSQKRGQFLDVEGQVVGVPRSRRNSASVTVSQKSLYEKKKAVASPFARQVTQQAEFGECFFFAFASADKTCMSC